MANRNHRLDRRLLCDPHTLERSDHATITARRREDSRPLLAHIIVVSCLPDGLMVRAAGNDRSGASWGMPWGSIGECRRGYAPLGAILEHLLIGGEVLTPIDPTHTHAGRPGRVHRIHGPETAVIMDSGEVEWHDTRALRPFTDAAGAPQKPAAAPALAPARERRRVPPGWTFGHAQRRLGPLAR